MRYVFRTFLKQPLFTTIAVLTLALGFGANTAIFSVIDAVVLHPLPYPDPDRLVAVWEKNPALSGFLAERLPAALKNYSEWKKQNHSFESMSAFADTPMNLTGFDKPEELGAALVTPEIFDVFQVRPRFGRAFNVQDGSRVAILDAAFHQRRFGGSPDAIGRTLTLNGSVYTIVGVLPASFHLPAVWEGLDQKKPQVWLPMDVAKVNEQDSESRVNFVFARVKPGVTLEQARSDMAIISARLRQQFPKLNEKFGVNVFPLVQENVGPKVQRGAVLLQFAVAFVLLIACANVANLLLTRAAAREKEIAVRMALGARRGDIVRQVLIESAVLGMTGGLAGVLIAAWIIKAITYFAPEDAYHLQALHLSGTVLAITFVMVFLAALLFGLVPAWYASRQNLNEALVKGGRSGSAGISTRLRNSLVVAEVALAVLLLVGSGLMIRSLAAMLDVNLGFRTDHVLTMHVKLPDSKYPKQEQIKTFCDQLLARVSSIPGVQSTAIASGLPMLDNISLTGYAIEGGSDNSGKPPVTDTKRVSEDYFNAIRQPITRGRPFTRQDAESSQPDVAIINEALANQIWHGSDPVGRVLLLGGSRRRLTLIGVTANTHQMGLETPTRPEVYLPSRRISQIALVVRTAGDPMRVSQAVSAQVWAIDKDQPVSDVMTLDQKTSEGNATRRFDALLFASFAGLALVLSAIGLYGVLAYGVAQRTREIGIRMALGADGARVARLVVGNGFTLTAIGLAIGLVAGFGLTRLMSNLVFGVPTTDLISFLGAVVVLAPIALLASYIPAYRASRIDPMVSLRVE